jgi:hypothetical protein
MENENASVPHSLRFLVDCRRAIADERYRDALEKMLDGLVDATHTAREVDSKQLMMFLFMAVAQLESTLKKAFGTDWEERVAIPEITEEEKKIRCSFCGKTQEEVLKIIAGAAVYICNECVGMCVEILSERAT